MREKISPAIKAKVTIMRFTTMDLLSEKYYHVLPYAYCLNNPMRYVDPDGRRSFPINDLYKKEAFRIDSYFGPRDTGLSYASKSHNGLDINFGSGSFDYGAPVLSTHDGQASIILSTAGNQGRNIIISSPNGDFRTRYFHLKDIYISEGEYVSESTLIGGIGGSRNGEEFGGQVHLHYQIERKDSEGTWKPYNPCENKENTKENVIDPQSWLRLQNKSNKKSVNLFSLQWLIEPLQRDKTRISNYLINIK